jgi:hypothetical protein
MFDPWSPPKGVSLELRDDGFRCVASTYALVSLGFVLFASLWALIGLIVVGPLIEKRIWFVLVPYLGGLVLVVAQALQATIGRVVITRNGDEGTASSGFWFLRRSKKFRWSRVIAVHEGDAHMGPKGGPPFQLIYLRILGEKKDETFKFGLHLPDERRHWVIALIGWQAQSTCNSPFLRLK